jgi:hypothetical protein
VILRKEGAGMKDKYECYFLAKRTGKRRCKEPLEGVERNVIGGGRMCGKTTELIFTACRNDRPLIVPTADVKANVKIQYRELLKHWGSIGRLDVFTIHEALERNFNLDEVYVDEMEWCFRELTRMKPIQYSTSMPMIGLWHYPVRRVRRTRRREILKAQKGRSDYEGEGDIK